MFQKFAEAVYLLQPFMICCFPSKSMVSQIYQLYTTAILYNISCTNQSIYPFCCSKTECFLGFAAKIYVYCLE